MTDGVSAACSHFAAAVASNATAAMGGATWLVADGGRTECYTAAHFTLCAIGSAALLLLLPIALRLQSVDGDLTRIEAGLGAWSAPRLRLLSLGSCSRCRSSQLFCICCCCCRVSFAQAQSVIPWLGRQDDLVELQSYDTPTHALAASAAKHDNTAVTVYAKAVLSVAMVLMSRWAGGLVFSLVGVFCASALLWGNWRHPPFAPMNVPVGRLPTPLTGRSLPAWTLCPLGSRSILREKQAADAHASGCPRRSRMGVVWCGAAWRGVVRR